MQSTPIKTKGLLCGRASGQRRTFYSIPGINSNWWCTPEFQREDDECVICLEKAKLRLQVQNMQKMHLAVKDVFINIWKKNGANDIDKWGAPCVQGEIKVQLRNCNCCGHSLESN